MVFPDKNKNVDFEDHNLYQRFRDDLVKVGVVNYTSDIVFIKIRQHVYKKKACEYFVYAAWLNGFDISLTPQELK